MQFFLIMGMTIILISLGVLGTMVLFSGISVLFSIVGVLVMALSFIAWADAKTVTLVKAEKRKGLTSVFGHRLLR